jgi:hypothetical protein
MFALKHRGREAEPADLGDRTRLKRRGEHQQPGTRSGPGAPAEAAALGSSPPQPGDEADSTQTGAGWIAMPSERIDATGRSGDRFARVTERVVLAIIRIAAPVLNRRCATLASVLGALGVAFGLVPLFFGLAWNFGGVATLLALYARYRRRQGDHRISRIATQTGFVLGVSAILLGCWDLVLLAAGG